MDEHWMDRAIFLARRALGRTAPNPAVGAVIVKGGHVLGEGFTAPVGGPHAEVVAIEAAKTAGADTRGATMYVTLEPCCHVGRTPPCTNAILAAGITRVVVGVVDAFPPMRGNGLAQLREAGVEVLLGVRDRSCACLVRGFTRAVLHGLPEVSAKAAISLDGRIATRRGESEWITGPLAREHGHTLRASHDAILVGIGTVIADDPRLTCRVGKGCDPVPAVLDTELRIPGDAALFRSSRRALVLCAEDAPERALPGEVVRLPRDPRGGIDIEAALRALVAHGLHRVLAEGGGRVHRSLLDQRLVDRLYLYVAGVLLPGGISWVGGEPVDDLGSAMRLGVPVVQALGSDLLLCYDVPHRLGDGGPPAEC